MLSLAIEQIFISSVSFWVESLEIREGGLYRNYISITEAPRNLSFWIHKALRNLAFSCRPLTLEKGQTQKEIDMHN